VLCAIAIQRAFARDAEANPEEPIRVRIGLHTGEAIQDEDKFFGKTVIQAFRVADLAEGGEILASRTVRDLAVGSKLVFEDRGTHALKGVAEPWQVFAVS